ncbi:MAG: ParM/StbA family protein [Syntrophorhabdales bacterium]|jgi:actin-related protein
MAIDCIGIDIGYGYAKTYRAGDKKMFPTAVCAMTREGTFSETSPVVVNGHRYLVAEDAEREGNTFDTRQSGFVASAPWLAVLAHCLWLNDFAGGKVVMGLPPGVYSKEYTQDILKAIRASDVRIKGEPYRISGNVRIIPQGAGIFFCHVKDHPGDFRKNVAVIDIGHRTMDMVFFVDGKYVESATQTDDIGMSVVLDNIMNAFLREYRRRIDFKAALAILRGGQITCLGETYRMDVREEIDAYMKQVCSVMDHYLEKLPLRPDLAIIGGGGAIIRDLAGRHNLLVVNEPAMANAIGYYYYGSNLK